MLAYNKNWLDALQIQDTARYYEGHGVISPETAHAIETQYPVGFYTPNWFIRIALAIFGWIMIMAAVGMLFVFFSWSSQALLGIQGLLIGTGLLFFLEKILIQGRHHYRSGLDDIFAYVGVGAILTGIFAITDDLPVEAYLLMGAVCAGIAAVRYADTPLTLFAAGCLTVLILKLVLRVAGDYAMLVLPFTGMLCAGFWYFWSNFLQKNTDLRFWQTPLQWIEAAALLLFYASGNFWCIHFFAKELFGAENVPLKVAFWAFTFAVPVLYILGGLYKKDRLLLDMGIFSVALALATLRYFHQVLPYEIAATLLGAFCVVIAWGSIQYLKTHYRRFTYRPDGQQTDIQKLQGNIVSRM